MNIEQVHAPPEWDGSQGLLAVIVRAGPVPFGTHFLTDPTLSQQVAMICRPAGHIISPHIHQQIARTVTITQEVLIVRRGRMCVTFFTSARDYVGDATLLAGDMVILIAGGHGFRFWEETELIEVKTGPFLGAQDKVQIGTSV